MKKMKTQTLNQAIKSNPYLKLSNCTDLSDVESAIDDLRILDNIYGENNKTLLKLWARFLDKKNKIEKILN